MNTGSIASYLGGTLSGFLLGLIAMLALVPWQNADLYASGSAWITSNLGYSVWLFALILIAWSINLARLHRFIHRELPLARVMQLDHLSDIWAHLFIGTGVVWTAIGMRSALETTLSAPGALDDSAGAILSRLVDGGILMALTTTIVGAIGGYLMQLSKSITLGAALSEYYHLEERREIHSALRKLTAIEEHFSRIFASLSDPYGEDRNAGAHS